MNKYLYILVALFLFPAGFKAQTADKYLRGKHRKNGVATIQSMYAPSFSGHSSGGKIKVK